MTCHAFAMRLAAVLAVACLSCGSAQRGRLYPAGSDKDDGTGDLARKSAHLLTSDEPEGSLFGQRTRPYGGDAYGGGAYGGATYAAYAPPSWSYPAPTRAPHYNQTVGLAGAIDGTVTWNGPVPPSLATRCGQVDNPSVRVGASKAVGGVLVYIEHIAVGRTIPNYGRPVSVGGTISKHGCALLPAVQIVTPLPASLAIHGDATRAKLVVTSPSGTKPYDLQEAGRVVLTAQPGVTRVESDDGSLFAAWAVALDTPYYAITDDTGHFRIDELAAGTYDVTFWQAPVAALAAGKIVYGAPMIVHRTIKVESGKPARLDVTLGR